MTLQALHQNHGAHLAPDGIPLHYGDLVTEYRAALASAILLDRSHEGRLQLLGKDRFELLNRMSTNQMVEMSPTEGRPTIFTSPTARIIDRIIAFNCDSYLQIITEPGRGAAVAEYLQRNIFFNDDAHIENISSETAQFSLHGPNADHIMEKLGVNTTRIGHYHSTHLQVGNATIFAARRKVYSAKHWVLIVPAEHGESVYSEIVHAGTSHGLTLAGSLTFNTIRIQAGIPARPELNTDYIPLEVGLWDEVHFGKGCYTGQEIIARMESRSRLAKTVVALEMEHFVAAPADIQHEGRVIGKLTSSVQAPDGAVFTIAILSTQFIRPGTTVMVGASNQTAVIKGLLGSQPDFISQQ